MSKKPFVQAFGALALLILAASALRILLGWNVPLAFLAIGHSTDTVWGVICLALAVGTFAALRLTRGKVALPRRQKDVLILIAIVGLLAFDAGLRMWLLGGSGEPRPSLSVQGEEGPFALTVIGAVVSLGALFDMARRRSRLMAESQTRGTE